MYTQKTIDNFRNPRNYGKIKKPSGIGKVGNIVCGDVMWLYIRVKKNKDGEEIIEDAKFETFGCVAAIATSSVVTDLALGKSLEEAMEITKDEVSKSLGGLPPVKLHCSVLAVDALFEAIFNYLSKNNRKISKHAQKRHAKIAQESKIIEEKYKDWVEMEKEMHRNDSK